MSPQEIAHLKMIESACRQFIALTRPPISGSSRSWKEVMAAVDYLKTTLDAYDAMPRDPRIIAAEEGAWS